MRTMAHWLDFGIDPKLIFASMGVIIFATLVLIVFTGFDTE
ncbi:hypothetical protein [Ancylobacter sp. G4_0304]